MMMMQYDFILLTKVFGMTNFIKTMSQVESAISTTKNNFTPNIYVFYF